MLKALTAPWLMRWQALAQRDRHALCIMGATLVAALFYAMLWQPSFKAQHEAKARYVKERELYGYISSFAAQSQANSQGATLAPAELSAALTALAARFNLKLEHLKANVEGEVELNLQAASAEPLINWLEAASGQGIDVRRIELSQSASGPLSAMLVVGVVE